MAAIAHRSPPKHRLMILACSATKQQNCDWAPALNRYNGPLWQTLRVADPNGAHAKVAALSARYGFIGAGTPIPNYNCKLTSDLANQMKAGGIQQRWPCHSNAHRVAPLGDCAATHIASLCSIDLSNIPFEDVAVIGGHHYVDVSLHFISEFKASGYIRPDASIEVINGPIGRMRQALRNWLLR